MFWNKSHLIIPRRLQGSGGFLLYGLMLPDRDLHGVGTIMIWVASSRRRLHSTAASSGLLWSNLLATLNDARKLKALEDENAKLKKLLAEAMLDMAILKDVASKKW